MIDSAALHAQLDRAAAVVQEALVGRCEHAPCAAGVYCLCEADATLITIALSRADLLRHE